MPFFPLTRIILFTLDLIWTFYFKYFQSYALLKLQENFCVFCVHRLLPYSAVCGKVGLVWDSFMSFYPINSIIFANSSFYFSCPP